MEINKGKKGEKKAPQFMEKGPLSSIGPGDGQGSAVTDAKAKVISNFAQKAKGATASLGDMASNSIKGAMGAIKSAGSRVNDVLQNKPLTYVRDTSVKRSPFTGQPQSRFTGVDRSATQPAYGTPKLQKINIKNMRPKLYPSKAEEEKKVKPKSSAYASNARLKEILEGKDKPVSNGRGVGP